MKEILQSSVIPAKAGIHGRNFHSHRWIPDQVGDDKKMKKLSLGIFCFIILYLGFILYTQRALFTSRFDAAYWKDRFEKSQWKLPVSTRTIGDDGLYLYAGYDLIRGGDPSAINPEMPPFGKYLIGWLILVSGNGYWYGFIITSLTIFLFFLLARTLQINLRLSLAVTLLFLTDPLVTSQFSLTMLDSLQLLFLLLTFLLLTQTDKSSKLLALLLGISFGLFSASKTPIFSPILAVVFIVFLKKPKAITLIFIGALIAYLLPYAYYFFLGHSLLDWINLQKWMVGFYKTSALQPTIGSVLGTLFFNRTQNLFTHVWETGNLWSPAWPLISLLATVSFFKSQKTSLWNALFIFTFLLFAALFLLPFWTRYLLLLLPFLYLSSIRLLGFAKSWMQGSIVSILLIANLSSSLPLLFPTPEATVKDVVYSWERGFFADVYEHLADGPKNQSRDAFHRFGLKTFYDGQIEAANINVRNPSWSRFESPQEVHLQITYFTRELGPFIEKRTLQVVKENGRWVIPWQWDNLIEGLSEKNYLQTMVDPAKRGSITTNEEEIIAQDNPSFLLSIIPSKVETKDEDIFLSIVETMIDADHLGTVSIHHRYVGNTLPDLPIPIGVVHLVPENASDQSWILGTYPALRLTPHFGRFIDSSWKNELGQLKNTAYKECCSSLYSTTNYDGVTGLEMKYNDVLKGINGGRLVIKDQHDTVTRTILDIQKKDGVDVSVEF